MVIRAIPTTYAKVKFRSKLESEWAKWLDQYGIKWSYETQGFDLGDGTWYLPDFYLPEINTIIEVKGIIEHIDKPYKLMKKLIQENIIYYEQQQKEHLDDILMNEYFEKEKKTYNPDIGIMLLLGGPVSCFYNIDDWYSDGIYTHLCQKCGKRSFITSLGNYSCRACGDHSNGGHINGERLPLLTRPLRWQFLERD